MKQVLQSHVHKKTHMLKARVRNIIHQIGRKPSVLASRKRMTSEASVWFHAPVLFYLAIDWLIEEGGRAIHDKLLPKCLLAPPLPGHFIRLPSPPSRVLYSFTPPPPSRVFYSFTSPSPPGPPKLRPALLSSSKKGGLRTYRRTDKKNR